MKFGCGHRLYEPVRPSVAFNLVDGVIRMIFFIGMIFSFSRLNDIKRVFEYHGAERKTVFAWEAGDEVDRAQRSPPPAPAPALRHQLSDGRDAGLDRAVLGGQVRFAVFEPVDANRDDPADRGRFVRDHPRRGQKESGAIFKLMTLPGIWLQNLTTREPSDDQLEVAIYALKESLKLEPVGGA